MLEFIGGIGISHHRASQSDPQNYEYAYNGPNLNTTSHNLQKSRKTSENLGNLEYFELLSKTCPSVFLFSRVSSSFPDLNETEVR